MLYGCHDAEQRDLKRSKEGEEKKKGRRRARKKLGVEEEKGKRGGWEIYFNFY